MFEPSARGVKVLAPILYPLYQILFNKALQNSLPPALKHGRTGLIAKADKTSTDPLTVQSPPYHFDPHVSFRDRLQAPRARLRPKHHQRESSRLHAPEKHAPPSHDHVLRP